MRHVYIASSNANKLREFRALAASHNISLDALPELSAVDAPEETGSTFEENAIQKAEFYSSVSAPQHWVVAEDSGLEVAALRNAPGVRSARYALDPAFGIRHPSDEENNRKLLSDLAQFPSGERFGRFVCVISAARSGVSRKNFQGEIAGQITREPRGLNGFGYDPIFLIPRLNQTMAELPMEDKIRLSHRGLAFCKFIEWFKER